MWQRTTVREFQGVSSEAVWQVWRDVNRWTEWHDDIDLCGMEGEFELGNSFRFKPKGGPEFRIVIVDLRPGRSFTDVTRFWGARMYDAHEVEAIPGGVRITGTITVQGPLSFLWTRLVAANVAASAPAEMEAAVARARSLALL